MTTPIPTGKIILDPSRPVQPARSEQPDEYGFLFTHGIMVKLNGGVDPLLPICKEINLRVLFRPLDKRWINLDKFEGLDFSKTIFVTSVVNKEKLLQVIDSTVVFADEGPFVFTFKIHQVKNLLISGMTNEVLVVEAHGANKSILSMVVNNNEEIELFETKPSETTAQYNALAKSFEDIDISKYYNTDLPETKNLDNILKPNS
ncbi:MAG: hypothetical protein QW303_01975 [Nitrososphaerota archaeon]